MEDIEVTVPPSVPQMNWLLAKFLSVSPALTDAGQRRQAQVVMWVGFIMAAWFLLATLVPLWMGNFSKSTVILLMIAVFSFIAYAISRTRAYLWASWLLTVMLLVSAYGMYAILPTKGVDVTFLGLVILSFVIGSAVLTVRGLSILVVINVILMILLGSQMSADALGNFFAVLGSAVMAGALLSIFSGVRNLVERERLQEVRAANLELRAIQETLEERVAERTRIAELAFEQAEAARRELENEIWLTRGLVAVNRALHGEDDLDLLAARSMGLCQHLATELNDQPVIAACFLLQDEFFEYRGGYAFAAPGDASPRFRIRDGLLGQAVQDHQPILIDHVPPDYMNLVSALGEIAPQQIAIWPLRYEDQRLGALELGCPVPLTPRAMQFLERAVESIAIVFHTVQAREQIIQLLAEAQAQSEKLQVREEQLRAVNKELTAQNEQIEMLA